LGQVHGNVDLSEKIDGDVNDFLFGVGFFFHCFLLLSAL
jgi:hypothetical protein